MALKKTHEQFLYELDQHNISFPEKQVFLCDGEIYQNLNGNLKFRCAKCLNEFLTSPRYITIKHSGCPKCGIIRTSNTQHSPVFLAPGEFYSGVHKKCSFVCSNNHQPWSATPISILQGHGCPTCAKDSIRNAHTHSHLQFINLLNTRNITFPSKSVSLREDQQYVQQNQKLVFRCNNGHEWNARPGDILHRNSGCPLCASSKTFSFMAIEWLTKIENIEQLFIQHRGNSEKEFCIPGTKYTVDGFCKSTNTVYEFHGNYWHGNPRMYNGEDTNERVGKSFGELYKETLKKEDVIKSLGYNLVVMWEDEYSNCDERMSMLTQFKQVTKDLTISVKLVPINEPYPRLYLENQRIESQNNGVTTIFIFEDEWRNNPTMVKTKLLHYSSNNNVSRIHARKCIIRPCSSHEKRNLLNQNHVQGNDNSQIYYGAYFDDHLVAIMTFTQPRVALGQKNVDVSVRDVWELSRFCTDSAYKIPGIASKLLKHFQRNHEWKEIYSYADKRWGVGNMYYQLGFELAANNPPDYYYIVNGERKHRWNYRKDLLRTKLPNYDSSLTEYQNMVNHGYYRVWNCGTLKFSIKCAHTQNPNQSHSTQ